MESFVTWKCQIYYLRPPYNMIPDKTFHFLLPIVISLKRNCAHLNARNKACFLLKSKIMKRAEKSEARDETNLPQPQDFCLSDSVSQFVTTCINLSHHRVSSCRRHNVPGCVTCKYTNTDGHNTTCHTASRLQSLTGAAFHQSLKKSHPLTTVFVKTRVSLVVGKF